LRILDLDPNSLDEPESLPRAQASTPIALARPLTRRRGLVSLANIRTAASQPAIAIQCDEEIRNLVEHTIYIPPELLLPSLEVGPLQLLAYHIEVRRGCE
jgi:glucosamine--fructose-6-phosphate aminotransferase (isomerizing)